MTTGTDPLLFTSILAANRLGELTATHDLTQAELDWLHHVSLPSHTQRTAQTPPMFVETILLQAKEKTPIALAGCVVLRSSSNNNAANTQPAFLYTLRGGLIKFDNLASLEKKINQMHQDTVQRNDLFRLLSISQRSELNSTTDIRQTRKTIDGGIFEALVESIEHAQNLNTLTMLNELIELPSLVSMLDKILDEILPSLDHRQARVILSPNTVTNNPTSNTTTRSLPLTEAILVYFHNKSWPAGHDAVFIHPDIDASPDNSRQWENIIKVNASNLTLKLTECIHSYWKARSSLYISRQKLLSQFIEDALQATILIQREKKQITEAQSYELLRLNGAPSRDEPPLLIKTVRLLEHTSNYVELAGSLTVSGKDYYLYTPNHGLQKVANNLEFKGALYNTSNITESEQAIYSLLSLEERKLFLRFDTPRISGRPVDLPVSETLASMIIDKQVENLHYALNMSHKNSVNIHSLIDEALDIRTLINKNLLIQKNDAHRGTQRATYKDLCQPNLLVDQLERKIKNYTDIEKTFHTLFTDLPITDTNSLRSKLHNLLPELKNIFSLGIRAEAELKYLNGSLPSVAHDLIKTIFAYDSGHSNRPQHVSINGSRPDVYSLKLAYNAESKSVSLLLANCFLLTEHGGLSTPNSGMAILWTPLDGLRVFTTVALATKQLNQQLLDSRKRFGLLTNLTPAQRKPHGHYQLQSYELIEGDPLLSRVNSFIEHFKAEHSYVNTLKIGDWQLRGSALRRSLEALLSQGGPTNLKHAIRIAQANRQKHKIPTWLGTSSIEEQKLHIHLLEQYKNSVTDGKDYLENIEPLNTYARKKIKALLNTLFANKNLDPNSIQITPNLPGVEPTRTLTEFALQPISITQKTEFKISSISQEKLPDGFNKNTVRQILSSLNIPASYKNNVMSALSGNAADIQRRKSRFLRMLPWQLLQHAHAQHLQKHITSTAFDLIRQVLDMPDAIAREAVEGANALIRPLELIKPGNAMPIKALGLYLIGSSHDSTGTQILYSPYHESHLFREFKDEESVIAAVTSSGVFQDMLVHRLPESQQAIFKNLFAATLGTTPKITLTSNPIQTNLLETLFNDNTTLLLNMLTTQDNENRQFDWSTALHLFNAGARALGKPLQGKLTFIETLWESYQDFKASAEALQQHDWKTGLYNFIAGAAEMVSLGTLNRDDTFGLLDPIEPAQQEAATATSWKNVMATAAPRTDLQPFEINDISLINLQRSPLDGTYKAPETGKLYAPIAGKVFQVAKVNQVWRIVHANGEGPIVNRLPDSKKWIIDPQRQTIRYGKAISTLSHSHNNHQETHDSLNIEAKGMKEIRRKYPYRANIITQALEAARYYSSNTLHNLNRLKQQSFAGARLDNFLKAFFGVDRVDIHLVKKIHIAIAPICEALADPTWELKNGQRITICSVQQIDDEMTAAAFVIEPELSKKIYLTQFFFNMGLDWYKATSPSYFNVDAHAQGAVLIHEISHQLLNTLDIVYLDATLPFLDLVSTTTHLGQTKYSEQKDQQRNRLSLTTPRNRLFMDWDNLSSSFKSLEFFPKYNHTVAEILKIAGARNMDEARDAFLDLRSSEKRIDIILRNADSLTLLICELGRQLDPTSP